jgi:hypothetical protein
MENQTCYSSARQNSGIAVSEVAADNVISLIRCVIELNMAHWYIYTTCYLIRLWGLTLFREYR